MGAGRTTETVNARERSLQSNMSTNSSVSARNLPKGNLAGVIFGCTHETMEECLSKLLFGLPYGHHLYVENIKDGLPLFLFNYSDRKLHGVYEAASTGQLYLKTSAWTDGSSQRTPYPAQVYVRVRVQCQPLIENQFKKVIEKNYYTPQHFWFELDHAQTEGLIALFKRSYSHINSMLSTGKSIKKQDFPTLQPASATGVKSKKDIMPSATSWKDIVTSGRQNRNSIINPKNHAPTQCSNDDSEFDTSSSVVEDTKALLSKRDDMTEENEQNASSGYGAQHISQSEEYINKELVGEQEEVPSMLQKQPADCAPVRTFSEGRIADNLVGYSPKEAFEDDEYVSHQPSVRSIWAESEEYSVASDVHGMTNSSLYEFSGYAEVDENPDASNIKLEITKLVHCVDNIKGWVSDIIDHQAEEIDELKRQVTTAERKSELLENRLKVLELEMSAHRTR